MNKKAYEKSVGFVLDKKAEDEFSWDNIWGGIKQHFTDNKDHYITALKWGIPALALGGIFGGKKGLAASTIVPIIAGLNSKYKWSQQLMDMFGSKKQTTGGTANGAANGAANANS